MSAFADLVAFLPVAGGTGDWVFSSAVAGCQSPTAANVLNGVSYKVYSISTDQTQWETSVGAYNSATGTFPRTTVLANSLGTGTSAGQTGAGTKINFATIPQVKIVALAEDLISVEVANSFTATQRQQARSNISVGLKGRLFGLTLSTAGGSGTISIAAGEAADSTGVDLMVLASAFTKTTSAWAVGTGNGALDTGTIASGFWYHVFLIKRPDTGAVDIALSLSATAPTTGTNIPAAFTLHRRIGSMLTDVSANWTLFHQLGDEFLWDVPRLDAAGGTAMSTTGALVVLSVPSSVQVNALFGLVATFNTSGNFIALTSPDQANTAASTSFCDMVVSASTGFNASQFSLRTNTSGQIRQRIDTGDISMRILTHGWIDTRGRLL